jgi:hypothetical protein
VTPEAPNRRRRGVAPVAPQCPLTPSGWHALRAGVWHRHRRVGVVAVSCRRVVAPVAPVRAREIERARARESESESERELIRAAED